MRLVIFFIITCILLYILLPLVLPLFLVIWVLSLIFKPKVKVYSHVNTSSTQFNTNWNAQSTRKNPSAFPEKRLPIEDSIEADYTEVSED